jgi:renalase
MPQRKSIGIIGAGITGLACGQSLRSAGFAVTVLEKSRGVGGRIATRRVEDGASFDHGAQYFTVKHPDFRRAVEGWCASGSAAEWKARIVALDQGATCELAEPIERYVGVPGMNAIAKTLAEGIEVRTSVTVQGFEKAGNQWRMVDSSGAGHGPFDLIITTAPPVQSAALIGDRSPLLKSTITAVTVAPCWALLLQFAEPLETGFDGAFVDSSPLSWVARNSSKPGRSAAECWVLHASDSWSRLHLEESPERIVELLLEAFWNATRLPAQSAKLAIAHRWRYALPQQTLTDRFLFDRYVGLGACGDWCGGPRVEGAYLSGLAMARALIEQCA